MEFEFVLKFDLPDPEADPAIYVDALLEAGCDDAVIGLATKGCISLDFSRDSVDALTAMMTAMEQVQTAIPGARLSRPATGLANAEDLS